MNPWYLAIDFGTCFTCAVTVSDGVTQSVTLGPDGQVRMPSSVVLKPTGELAVGFDAERQSRLYPQAYEPTPKRHVGQASILLGAIDKPVVEVIAAVLGAVALEARRQRGGTPPAAVCLTYPARWAEPRQAVLRDAATRAGLGDVALISEPAAAATYFAALDVFRPGQAIAVYDLGGGTFDAAVLMRTPDAFRLIGRPGGIDPFGGDDVDQRLLGLCLSRLTTASSGSPGAAAGSPAWTENVRADFRREVRRVKEELATSESAELVVPHTEARLTISRSDLRTVAGADVGVTVAELIRVLNSAALADGSLSAIYLAGGASRLPLVREQLGAQLAPDVFRMIRTLNDPKLAISLGAAQWLQLREGMTVAPLVRRTPRRRPRWYEAVAAAAVVVGLVAWGIYAWGQRKSNEVVGRVVDSHGRAVADAPIELDAAEHPGAYAHTDSSGHYRVKVASGGYTFNEAWVTVQHNGTAMPIKLRPASAAATIVQFPTHGDHRINWTMAMSGQVLDEPQGSYYGREIDVRSWFDFSASTGVEDLSAVPSSWTVDFVLTPIGDLLDGSPATVRSYRATAADVDRGFALRDIPLADYTLTVFLDTPEGRVQLAVSWQGGAAAMSVAVPVQVETGQLSSTWVQAGLPPGITITQ